MAVVYRARDMRRPRAVAIKVLRPEIAQLIGTTRFLREIAVTSAFSHPNILPLIDSGEITDDQGRTTPFYVMPLVEGETLHERMVRSGRLPIGDLLRIAREILEALQYAHSKGVIHRDIKPANILLSNGHAVVADFGVARPFALRNAAAQNEPELTLVGEIVGTPTYMSPEQANGNREVDARADLFSVGCVLYEMAVGVRPFETPIPQLTAARKTQGIYLPTSNHRSDVPAALDDIMEKALKPNPDDRYRSANEFIEALSHVTVHSKPAPSVRVLQTRRWMKWGVAAAVLVAGVAAAAPLALRKLQANQAASVVPGSDLTRVAVLPIETTTPDSLLSILGNGFQSDLIDELAQFPALTVISKNGVVQFRGNASSTDSIGRTLRVGSIVTGDIRRSGDTVRVTVRLIDGATGEQRSKADAFGSIHDLLAVRSSVLDSVTSFLRKAIGSEIGERERQIVRSSEAWEIVARIRSMAEPEQGMSASLPAIERLKRVEALDSALMKASGLDRQWPVPLNYSAQLLLQRGNVEDQLAVRDIAASAAHTQMARDVRLRALDRVNAALQRSPANAEATYLRGKARFDLWRTSAPVAPDSLRVAAERDMRDAVKLRPDLAQAWNDLSFLLQMSGEYATSRGTADTALLADAYLQNAPQVINRLLFTSLALGGPQEARTWCEEGRKRAPKSPQFWGCELTILGWTASSKAAVDSAWKSLKDSEAMDTQNQLASGWATRRLLVAAIAARAGLTDSAVAISERVRAALPVGIDNANADFGEAYVQTLLGHTDLALPLLQRYLKNNPALRGQMRKHPWFVSLRSNDTFKAITAPQ